MVNGDLFNEDIAILKVHDENLKLKQEVIKLKEDIKHYEEITGEAEYLKPHKTFGLTVSGDVLLNKLEVTIVNTPTFQRLRKIKQLGSTYLVYPTAIHTRFEHALGTLKQADIIINKIRRNKHSKSDEKRITSEEEQIIRLLALLHDIGHMPFGHTIEDEFGVFISHDKHDARWEYFLGKTSDIGKAILEVHSEESSELYKRFFRLIKCEKNFENFHQDAFMYDIVSNTVCSDLLDYLQRDCFYTNLRFRFHPRFLDYFFIKSITVGEKTERRIAIRIYKKDKKEIRHDVISELIQLLRYRYYLGERVYYHHAKIVTGTIISAAVQRAKVTKCFTTDSERAKEINKDLPEEQKLLNLHDMGDEELILYLRNISLQSKLEQDQPTIIAAKNLADNFDNRILYSEIFKESKENLGIVKEDLEKLKAIIKLRKDESEEKNKKRKNELLDIIHALEIEINGTLAYRIYDRLLGPGSASNRLELENLISSFINQVQIGDVLIYCPPFNMAMKLAEVKLVNISSKSTIKDFESVVPLREFKPSDTDYTIVQECAELLELHQELWAFRIFINPKLLELKTSNIKTHVINFLKWQLLYKNSDEQRSNGEEFIRNYVLERKSALKPEETSTFTFDDVEKLVGMFLDPANSLKNGAILDQKIKEIYNANSKK